MLKLNIYILILFIFFIILFLLLIIKISYNKYNKIENFNNNFYNIKNANIIRNYIDNNRTEEYIQFNTSGTIEFFIDVICDVLIVGGGGGGGRNDGDEGGGGGGGGGIGMGTINFKKNNTYTITIGDGGIGSINHGVGNNGLNTSIVGNLINEIAYGGGGGGWQTGNNGGSGGGGSGYAGNFSGGIAIKGSSSSQNSLINYYGNSGGFGYWQAGGGGGGGAYNIGLTTGGQFIYNGANGGSGILCNINNKYYGGGGGGSRGKYGNSGGIGGIGGGGNGGNRNNPTSGIENTGGGGGGSSYNKAGNGGSGVVILKYKIPESETRKINNLISISNHIYEEQIEEIVKYPVLFINSYSEPKKINNNEYIQTFIINRLIYTINFSYYNDNLLINPPHVLFDSDINYNIKNKLVKNYKNNIINTYNNIGNYIGSSIYNKNGIVNENGEWISITFPYSFILKKYGFIAIDGLENCAPGIWKLYGKNNDNDNFTLIDENIVKLSFNDFYNSESLYLRNKIDNNKSYKTYLFIFKSLAESNINDYYGGKLNFTQIVLYGLPQ